MGRFLYFFLLSLIITSSNACSNQKKSIVVPDPANCVPNSLGGCEQDADSIDSSDTTQVSSNNNLTVCEKGKTCSCSEPDCALVCEQANTCECDGTACKILCAQDSTCVNKASDGKIDCVKGAKSCECQHAECEVVTHDTCENGGKCDCKEEQCTVECGQGGICTCSGLGCVSVCAPQAQCSCSGEQCAVICPEGAGSCECKEEAQDCLVIPTKTCQENKPCSSEKDGALVECAPGGDCTCSGNLCTVICHSQSEKCACSGDKCIVGECVDGDKDPRCSCSGKDCFIAPPLGEQPSAPAS